ncbi:hypothetical protein KKP97_05220 [Methanothermococcus sp. SCGC AD-155-C09]|nr:hypothetical protein [Methanothermococcus sp. SCGC AD-155-C09]
MVFTVTVSNREGAGTGGDGGEGVGVKYYLNGQLHDKVVPNNGSLTFECNVQDNGFLCEVYRRWASWDYEDKWVTVTAIDKNGHIYRFTDVHIGNNNSNARASCTYRIDNASVVIPPPEHIIYNVSPISIFTINDSSGDWWGIWHKMDIRDKAIDFTDDAAVISSATLKLYKDGMLFKEISTSGNRVLLKIDGYFVLSCSVGLNTRSDGFVYLGGIKLGAVVHRAPAGSYKLVIELAVPNGSDGTNTYTLVSTFEVRKEVPTYATNGINLTMTPTYATNGINLTMTGELDIRPVCSCYLNLETEKTVEFTYQTSNVDIQLQTDIPLEGYLESYIESLKTEAKYYLRLVDEYNNELHNEEIFYNTGEINYTFNIPPDSKKEYKWQFIGSINGTEFILDEKEIIVLRQKYCHSLQIKVKMFDLAGNEIDKIPHPTSADYKSNQHAQIKVQISIMDEQGKLIDVPIDKIITNWQHQLSGSGGIYEFIIPNNETECLSLGNYGIAVYVDVDWCITNGYYNSYVIEAENVMVGADNIEKIMFIGAEVVNYENGITYLNAVYEAISGIFVNPMFDFETTQQLSETQPPTNQYQFCYTPFIASQTLNIPTYTEDGMKELAQAIMRELAHPRKKESFTIMDKELPKLNQSITLNINGKLKTITIQSLSISIANKELNIDISNEEQKLLKDYLSMIK